MRSDADTVDLRVIGAALRYGVRWVIAGVLVGLLLAGLVIFLVRPRYESTATVLLRSQSDPAAGFSSGGNSDGEGGGPSLGGLASLLSLDSRFETELEILTSRSVVGAVVDSLGLQARVLEPRGARPASLFTAARYPEDLAEGEYHFERVGPGYRFEGPGVSGRALPGVPVALGGAVLTLQTGDLPDAFTVELEDAQDAVERVQEELDAEQVGGDVAEIVFHALDPVTAAAVPNALVSQYLKRRKTTDRGVNQYRYEFLTQKVDSTAAELARAEGTLREHQERSGVLDPAGQSGAEIQRAMALRSQLETNEIEVRAMEQVIAQSRAGALSARELAAYPSLFQNPAINNLLSRLFDLETRRAELLDRRTERDPDVVTLSQSIDQLEAQLVSLASAYRDGLVSQQTEIRSELRGYDATLDALPAQVETSYRLEREVERLSELLVALQTQLVRSGLMAIGEGGDVRQIDPAEPPKEPNFPRPLLTLAGGLLGGLFFGVVGAIGSGYLRERIREPWEAQVATGAPAVLFDPRHPILLGGIERCRSVLVVPIGPRAKSGPVAERLAATAALQGRSVVFADLENPQTDASPQLPAGSQGSESGGEKIGSTALQPVRSSGGEYLVYRGHENGDGTAGLRRVLEQLEQRFSLVVVAVPGLQHPRTVSLFDAERPVMVVARAGAVTRPELQDAVEVFDRIGVRTAGVILVSQDADGARDG